MHHCCRQKRASNNKIELLFNLYQLRESHFTIQQSVQLYAEIRIYTLGIKETTKTQFSFYILLALQAVFCSY